MVTIAKENIRRNKVIILRYFRRFLPSGGEMSPLMWKVFHKRITDINSPGCRLC